MLLMEEQIRAIMKHDTKLKYREKCAGLVPWGSPSPLGDFPADYPMRKPPVLRIRPHTGPANHFTSLSVKRKPNPPTDFRKFYERGDLPIIVGHSASNRLQWLQDMEKLDYHHYLPIFFDGLREQEEPFRFLAVQGAFDLLNAAKGTNKIVPVIPQLIIPLKTALNTKDKHVVRLILKTIQAMIKTGPLVGEALVPYYRQLIPTMALYRSQNENIGDRIAYGRCIGDLVEETLMLMEEHGGSDAFINIKYMIPTYESTAAMGN
jgi:Parkin co-regulated protein